MPLDKADFLLHQARLIRTSLEQQCDNAVADLIESGHVTVYLEDDEIVVSLTSVGQARAKELNTYEYS